MVEEVEEMEEKEEGSKERKRARKRDPRYVHLALTLLGSLFLAYFLLLLPAGALCHVLSLSRVHARTRT